MYTTLIDGEVARSSMLLWISTCLAWLCLEANALAVSAFREYTALRVHWPDAWAWETKLWAMVEVPIMPKGIMVDGLNVGYSLYGNGEYEYVDDCEL
jgi:hypothetical protein